MTTTPSFSPSTEFDRLNAPDPVQNPADPQRSLVTEELHSTNLLRPKRFQSPQERYEVLEKLGEGGMGIVELVKDHYLGREVARKTLKTKINSIKKQKKIQEIRLLRLKREASITAILEHPNIVPLYEMQENEATNELQFTMRKVEGETLRQFFLNTKKEELHENKLLNIFRKVCEGVSYAHSKGIVHRDLKPENIMIGKFGEVYVMDWGIAKQIHGTEETRLQNKLEPEQFQTIGGLGTYGYMAPEQQLEASQVTPQADIYALGKILRECFTQQTPLQEMQHHIDKILAKKIPEKLPLRESIQTIRKIPEEIEAIEKKATREKSVERYLTVEALLEDLDRYQNHLRVSAKDYGFLELFQKWGRRNQKELSALGILLTLLLTFILYHRWKDYQKREFEASRFYQQSLQKKEKAQKQTFSNKQEQEEKIQYLLESFNDIEDALKLKPQEKRFETEKISLGEELIRHTCLTQDYRLARYISKQIQDSSLLTELEKIAWNTYVTQERDRQLRKHQKILQEWIIKAKSEWRNLEEGDVQDFIFEISQMKEPEILEQLLQELSEALRFFQEYPQDSRSVKQEEYYCYIVEILGRLGNPRACKPLLSTLEQFSKKVRSAHSRSDQTLPIGEWEFMISLAEALGNLKNQSFGTPLNLLRGKIGRDTLFGRRTERSLRKLMDGVIEDHSRSIQNHPTAENYYYRAMANQEKNLFREAIQDYTESLRLDPQHADAYNNRGLTKMALADFDGAIQDYTEALRYNPQNAGFYLNRGSAKQQTKDFSGAIQDYNEAICLNPQYAKAYNERGTAKENLKDLEGALFDYSEAIRLDPQHIKAYMNRGNIKQFKKDFQGALEDYAQAIRLDPHYTDIYNNRGNLKYLQSDFEGAIADYTTAIRLNPQYPLAYYNRGNAKRIKQDLNGALLDFNEAIRLNPKMYSAYYHRGFLREQKREFHEAIQDWEQALLMGNDPKLLKHLMDVLKQQSRESFGKKDWNLALSYLMKLKKYLPAHDPQHKGIDQKIQEIEKLLSLEEKK